MIENIFMNSEKEIRVAAFQKPLSFPPKLNPKLSHKIFASPTLARVSGCCRVPGVDIGQLWSELTLMGRWWQPVATPGQSQDPGDTEHWPGAGSGERAVTDPGHKPRPE